MVVRVSIEETEMMSTIRAARACSGLPLLALVLFLPSVVACGSDVGDAGPDANGVDEASCADDRECASGTYCEANVCIEQVCVPGEARCDGGDIVRCDERGSGYLEPLPCSRGTCEGGRCVCTGGPDCGDESCAGERCGGVCCEGETPRCGPGGQCVPDCEGQGELCGEALDACCASGDVCVFGACRTPGAACAGPSDCDFGEYCDAGLERCMPNDFPDGQICEIDYDFDPFEIEELWHWSGIALGDRFYVHVQSIPVTADMTGDGTPEVVITPYHQSDQHRGILVVVDGVTGDTLYYNDRRSFAGQGHAAVADVTGDGRPEIAVNLGIDHGGVALVENPINCPDPEEDPDDCIRWEVRSGTLSGLITGNAPLFADLRGDGSAQVIVGTTVIDALTGEVIADGSTSSRAHNGLETWGAAVVADLDGDGTLELLTGDCAWKVDFDEGALVEYWCNDEFGNGIPAVADIVRSGGREGLPEVAVVRNGVLRILDGQSGETLHAIDVPGGGAGGPPNIADFDGDGTVEIGLPGIQCYSVFDLACLEESEEPGACERPTFPDCTPGAPLPDGCRVDPCDDPALTGGAGNGVLWSIEVQDRSQTTGSSVFDFQGNGRSEVVYNDECRLLVLDGRTGQPHISRINTTRTATEYPLVVDVNGDGRSNIAVIANNDQFARDCQDFVTLGHAASRPDWFPECFPADPSERPDACDGGTSGVFALQDVHDAWVRTRAIWNQHAYHITNIEDDGRLPATWEPPWERFNTFRANRQGAAPLNAPNIAIRSMSADTGACPAALDLLVTVENIGVASIPAGLPVTLYRATEGEPVAVETRIHGAPISPGGAVALSFRYEPAASELNEDLAFIVVANDDGDGEAPIFDCNPETATATIDGLRCELTEPG
jgi:hypothetical protein